MGKSLKSKLTIGALGIVILVCIAIVIAVSYLIDQQNLQAVQRNLDKAAGVCRVELGDRKDSAASEINRMVVENSIGAMVKFLHEFSDSNLSMTESSYHKASIIVMKKAMAINFAHLGLYDLSGTLQVFALRASEDAFRFGFYKSPQVHTNLSKKGEPIDEGAWQSSEQVSDIPIPTQLNTRLPAEKQIMFIDQQGKLAIEAYIPVFATDYDEDDNPILKQFGVVHGVKEIETDFIDRLHLLTGMSINLFSGSTLSLGQMPLYDTIDLSTLSKNKESETLNEIQIKENTYFLKAVPTFNKDQISGAVAILQSDEIVKNNTFQMMKMLTLVCLVCLVLIIPLVIVFSRSVVRPLLHILDTMKDIAEGDGDLRSRIPITAKDEIGQLADNFNRFVEKIQIMVTQVKENLDQLNASSSGLSQIASTLASGAEQSSEKAIGVASAGEQMSANMHSIAATMEQAASNISMVSDNAQQMSGSINEVKEATVTATDISGHAVEQAIKASAKVGELGKAASEIEMVIETITDISEQVNLLSLNATIEAARAGEAGKGFAVVANEIKALANQTAAASDEIKDKVTDIQSSTDATVKEIEAITRVNNEINDIVQTTSRRIEEQSVATSDIAENVSQASVGISDVNESVSQSSTVAAEIATDISDVTHAAEEISSSSTQVKSRATELSDLSEQLKEIVDRFKV